MNTTTLPMYQKLRVVAFLLAMIIVTAFASSAGAGVVTKHTAGSDLGVVAAWGTGSGPLPATGDVATWSGSSLGGTLTDSTVQTWGAIDIEGASAALSVSGSALTLSGSQTVQGVANSGIYIAAGGQNLTIANSLTLGGNQTWTVAGGKTLTIGTTLASSTKALSFSQSGSGTAVVTFNSSANGVGTSYSGAITVNSNVKVQSQGQGGNTAFGNGTITLAGGQVSQFNGSWAWGNSFNATAASTIGQDSSNGRGRQLKLLGNLTSANNSGLTFLNNSVAGTRTDDSGFILANAGANTYATTTISAESRVRVGGNANNSLLNAGASDAGTRGSLGTGDVTLSATTAELAFTWTDTHTVANKITGSGTVQIGGGTAATAGSSSQIVTFTGANDYTGTTTIKGGTLSVASLNYITSGTLSPNTSSSLGHPTTAANGTIGIGSIVTAGAVSYTGAGETSDRVLNLAGTSGGATLDQSGTGLLKFTSATTTTGVGSKTLTLQGSTAGTGEIGAAIVDNSTTGTTTLTTATSTGATTMTLGSVDGISVGAAISGTGIPGSTTVSAVNTSTKVVTISAATTANQSAGITITVAGVKNLTSLAKSGTGTWTLSGANTYSGATTISLGTLALSGSGSIANTPNITVAPGAFFDVSAASFTLGSGQTLTGAGTVTGTVNEGATGGTITASGGNLSIGGLAATGTGTINVTPGTAILNVTSANGLNPSGAASSITVNLNASTLAAGSYTLIDYSGTIQGTGFSAFTLGTTPGGAFSYTLVDNTGNSSVDLQVQSLADVWSGAFSTEWSTAAIGGSKNWTVSGSPADYADGHDVQFTDVATGTTVDISAADVTPNSVQFYHSTKNFTLQGTAAIAGGIGLTKSGNGTLTINNVNKFTGAPMINAGTVAISTIANGGVDSPLGAGTSVALAGGKLSYTGGTASSDRTVNVTGASTLEVATGGTTLTLGGAVGGTSALTVQAAASAALTLDGAVTTTASLTKTGNGTLTLNNAGNTYNGGTAINAGTLKIGSATALGSGAASVTSGAVLDLNGTTMTSTGGLTLNGTGISSGGALINSSVTAGTYAGLLTLGSASSIIAGSGVINLSNTGTITGSGYGLTVGGAYNTTIAGIMGTGTGTLTKQDAGTLTLANAGNSYTGDTTISAGTLEISGGGRLGSGTYAGSISIAGTLKLNSTATQTLSGNISGVGSLTKRNTGILILTGTANTFSGLIDIGAGDVVLNNVGSENGAPSVNMSGGRFILSDPFVGQTATIGNLTGVGGIINPMYNATTGIRTLQVNQTTDGAFAGSIADGGGSRYVALIKTGSATLTLSGANTFTGATMVNNGTLVVNGSLASGSAVTVSGGTLAGTGTIAGALDVQSGGTLSPGASIGTLTLGATPSLGGTTRMEIDRGATPNADKLNVTGTLNYGGTLTVVNTGAALEGGEVFDLFDATAFGTTEFSTVNLPLPLGAGLNWWTGLLATEGKLVVNQAPANAQNHSYNRANGISLKIAKADLMAGVTDADSDTLTCSLGSAGSQGATVSQDATYIYYTPANNNSDTLTFTVNDGRGGVVEKNITITVTGSATGTLTITHSGAGAVTLRFYGIPNYTYWIQRNLDSAGWLDLVEVTAASNGLIEHSDTPPEGTTTALYRTRSQ